MHITDRQIHYIRQALEHWDDHRVWTKEYRNLIVKLDKEIEKRLRDGKRRKQADQAATEDGDPPGVDKILC